MKKKNISLPRSALQVVKNRKLKLDELISNRYPPEKINEAIKQVEGEKALHNIIMF